MTDCRKTPGVLENRNYFEVGEVIEGFHEEIELSFKEVLLLTFLK